MSRSSQWCAPPARQHAGREGAGSASSAGDNSSQQSKQLNSFARRDSAGSDFVRPDDDKREAARRGNMNLSP